MFRARCIRPLHHLRGERIFQSKLAYREYPSRGLVTLAIESSCDDTSVAVLEKDASGKATLHFHEKVTADNKQDRGINPKTTAISHSKALGPLVQKALAHLPPSTRDDDRHHQEGYAASSPLAGKVLDFVSVTRGPGLFSPLSIGLSLAKGLAIAFNVPLVGVNHMQAHALTPRLVSALNYDHRNGTGNDTSIPRPPPQPSPAFPFLSLLVSGGHTMILSSSSLTTHTILGNTMDIAAGDALDKMARLILPADVLHAAPDVSYARALETFVFGANLPTPDTYDYQPPEARADELSPRASAYGWSLPVPLTRDGARIRDPNMSFAGINSAVERICKARPSGPPATAMSDDERRLLGYEAMRVTFEHIASRILMQLEPTSSPSRSSSKPASLPASAPTPHPASPPESPPVTALVASGGVAANRFLRHLLRRILDARGFAALPLDFPPLELCTDNAAMIAWAGMEMFDAGWRSELGCQPHSRWSMDPGASDGGILGVGGWVKWK